MHDGKNSNATGSAGLNRTSRPLPREAVLPALESVLRSSGASIVKSGDLYKIVPTQEATRQTGTIRVGRSAKGVKGFGIYIVPMRYVGASEMAKILEPLAPKGNILRVDTKRNLLVIAASHPDIDTLLDAVNIFDVDLMAGMSFGLFPLEFADAKTLSDELGKVFGEGQGKAPAGVPLVNMPAEVACTAGTKYGPVACTGTRSLTVMPHDV